jgi:hypothetical protein
MGYSVLSVELDVALFKPVRSFIDYNADFSTMFFQRTTDDNRRNLGFVYLNPTNRTKLLLTKTMEIIQTDRRHRWDQGGFNLAAHYWDHANLGTLVEQKLYFHDAGNSKTSEDPYWWGETSCFTSFLDDVAEYGDVRTAAKNSRYVACHMIGQSVQDRHILYHAGQLLDPRKPYNSRGYVKLELEEKPLSIEAHERAMELLLAIGDLLNRTVIIPPVPCPDNTTRRCSYTKVYSIHKLNAYPFGVRPNAFENGYLYYNQSVIPTRKEVFVIDIQVTQVTQVSRLIDQLRESAEKLTAVDEDAILSIDLKGGNLQGTRGEGRFQTGLNLLSLDAKQYVLRCLPGQTYKYPNDGNYLWKTLYMEFCNK